MQGSLVGRLRAAVGERRPGLPGALGDPSTKTGQRLRYEPRVYRGWLRASSAKRLATTLSRTETRRT